MSSIMKHVFTLLTALFFISTTVQAQFFEKDGYSCEVIDDVNNFIRIKAIDVATFTGVVNIPEIIQYQENVYIVTELDQSAFRNCSNMTGVNIPGSIQEIKKEAFYACTKLASVSIPDNVTVLGDHVFQWCAVLESASIGKSLATIGEGVFFGCEKLKTITLNSNNAHFSIVDGVLFNKNQTELVCYPPAREGELYEIPSSVETVASNGFTYSLKLKNIVLNNSIKTIGNYAFSHCIELETIVIPSLVTAMGNSVFYYCQKLNTIVMQPETAPSLGQNAFMDTPNPILYISPGATGYNNSVWAQNQKPGFSEGGMLYTLFPSDNTKLQVKALHPYFTGQRIIKNNFTSGGQNYPAIHIEEYAFTKCTGLESLVIGASIQSVGNHAFTDCKALTEYIVDGNSSVYSSVDGVLFNKDKSSLLLYPYSKESNLYTVPNTVTTIGSSAFAYTTKLEGVIIPSSVNKVMNYGFMMSTALKSIKVPWLDPNNDVDLGSSVFVGVDKNICVLNIPQNTKSKYQAIATWNEFKNIVEYIVAGISNDAAKEINIYPNPATDHITITNNGGSKLIVADMQGKIIYEKKDISASETIDISGWQNGIYIVTVEKNNLNKTVTKIIKR